MLKAQPVAKDLIKETRHREVAGFLLLQFLTFVPPPPLDLLCINSAIRKILWGTHDRK
jgi:hypothetical protein